MPSLFTWLLEKQLTNTGPVFDRPLEGYLPGAEVLGAKYAVDKRRGDCTEYAYLVTALARVNGIVARPLGGYVMDRNGSPKADEYHNWAEVYVDGSWRLIDAQKENNQTNIEQYVAMQVISQKIPNSMETAHRFPVKGKIAVHVN